MRPFALAGAPVFTAPAEVANQAGRLDTVSLTDLGGRSASLSTFVSDGSSFTKQLFWTSAKGKLDAARCKLAGGDLNNDGLPDAVVLYNLGKGKSALLTFLSSGTTFVRASAWRGSLSWAASRLAVGDAGGDGADDVFVLTGKGRSASSVLLFTSSTSSSTAAPTPVKLTCSTLAASLPEAAATTLIAAADVNADGRAELVSLVAVSAGQARLDVLAAGQGGWTSATFWRGPVSATGTRFACADVDSDGRADAVLFAAAGSSSRLSVLAGSGSAFAAPAVWWQGPAATAPFAQTRLALGDVSGDGRADAVLLSAASATKARLIVAVSSGGAFTLRSFWSGSLTAARTQLACAPFSPSVVPSTTKSLDVTTLAALASVSTDGSVFGFSSATPQLGAVRVGDVVAAPPCPLAPEGLLRKVTAVSDEGRTLTTAAASLEEAFSSAEVSLHRAVRPADLGAPTEALPGVRLVRTRAGRALGKITISLKDVKIDSVELDGQISIEQDYDFTFDVGWEQANWYSVPTPKLKTLSFIQTTTQANELRLSAPLAKVGIKEEVLISFPLATFVVPVAGVPVTITPTLEVRIGVEGKVEAGITTAVTQVNVLRLGATYENGGFHAVQKFTPSATYEPPNLKLTAELEAYAKANLLLAVYGTAGPYAGAKAYVKLAADPAATPWWSLRYGVDASLGFEVKVFSHLLVDWSYEKNLYDKEIAHAEEPGPGPGEPFPICTAPGSQLYPAISGGTVVWHDERAGHDIYAYDLTAKKESLVSTEAGWRSEPAISGNTVVWMKEAPYRSFGIYSVDLSTGRESLLAANPAEQNPGDFQGPPDISGDTVVWRIGYFNRIHVYNLSTQTDFQMDTDPWLSGSPAVSGDTVVWYEGRPDAPSDSGIYAYNLVSGKELRVSTGMAMWHWDISGDTVVWDQTQSDSPSDMTTDVIAYDLAEKKEYLVCASTGFVPAVCGNIVVWQDHRNGNWDIYGYDPATHTEFPVCVAPGDQFAPDISGTTVVWYDYRNGNADIYGAVLGL